MSVLCRWKWDDWRPRRCVVEYVEAENSQIYSAESYRIEELQRYHHLECGLSEFSLLEYPSCLLQVIYISHNHLSGSNTSCRNLLHIPLCLDYLKSIRVWGNFLYLFPSAIFKLIYRNQNWPKSFSICSNVVVQNVTILAPYDSPNTDGIDPGTWTYAFMMFPSLKRGQ